eukprot:CAMPEP_0196737042 /NCGR_PEP_ID=MMETSP1091-20130531/14896_1 /TAXON_ID=302021 /ORGANISM="Rhodomonas sp., Strain CCMP768" /LENGTH=110 /DNA_ID=CAMNT_0042080841 /DNA_START=22 /DNA_END=354 /DNA_ORIENTATION=+
MTPLTAVTACQASLVGATGISVVLMRIRTRRCTRAVRACCSDEEPRHSCGTVLDGVPGLYGPAVVELSVPGKAPVGVEQSALPVHAAPPPPSSVRDLPARVVQRALAVEL